ncbi:hypothetical protein [Gulbenkiania mobilis]|uniref:hypothetical protein n=1 Tax=Gulbenkiania mobilis TaxID=397457 RepID=UPI00128F67E8|nr:hypothetical protein [Gulbenkiania mobilis]
MKRIAPLLWLSLTLASANVLALDTLSVQWRSAAEVAAALRPHLKPGETLSALDQTLIIDAPPARSAQLQALARTLDVRPAQLRVEWREDTGRAGGKATIDWGGTGNDGGWSVSADRENSSTQGLQTVTVLDGRSAFIALSRQVWLPWSTRQPNGGVSRGVTPAERLVSGLYVTPRLAGNHVRLDLSGKQDMSSVATSIEGPLNSWLEVGRIVRDRDGNQRFLVGGSTNGSQLVTRLSVRVVTER